MPGLDVACPGIETGSGLSIGLVSLALATPAVTGRGLADLGLLACLNAGADPGRLEVALDSSSASTALQASTVQNNAQVKTIKYIEFYFTFIYNLHLPLSTRNQLIEALQLERI